MMNTVQRPIAKSPFTVIEEWPSDSMEPTIAFGDLISVTPTQGIEADGVYMLIYQRSQIQPKPAQRLVSDVLKVIRRVHRLEDGRLHLSYDGALSKCEEIVAEDDLLRWCSVAGQVSVVQSNGRGFYQYGDVSRGPDGLCSLAGRCA